MSERKSYTEQIQQLIAYLSHGLHEFRTWSAQQFAPADSSVEWRSLARAFFKLGATGFGGGLAVIAQIRRLVVHDRRWLSEEEFLDAVSLAQSLPGANAANAITYVGLKVGGIRGSLVSVTSFVLPSFLMMIGLTVAHGHLINYVDAQRVFQGFNAAVVGLIAATTVRLGQTAMQQQWHLELGVAVGFLLMFTQTTVAEVVLLAGIVGILIRSYKARTQGGVRQRLRRGLRLNARVVAAEQQARQSAAELIEHPDTLADDHKVEVAAPRKTLPDRPTQDKHAPEKPAPEKNAASAPADDPSPPQPPQPETIIPPPLPQIPIGKKGVTRKLNSFAPVFLLVLVAWPIFTKLLTVWQLATIFARVGTVTFGGGFVMIPQIETDIVETQRWMSHQTFAYGMAFGQITPGPVLITATFIGFKVAGVIGAIAATVAAFAPSYLMTVVAGASINRFRTNFHVQAFLAGVAPAVVGMLAAAGVSLAKSGLSGPVGFGVATLACLLMLRATLHPVLIIMVCGLLQVALSRGMINWLHL